MTIYVDSTRTRPTATADVERRSELGGVVERRGRPAVPGDVNEDRDGLAVLGQDRVQLFVGRRFDALAEHLPGAFDAHRFPACHVRSVLGSWGCSVRKVLCYRAHRNSLSCAVVISLRTSVRYGFEERQSAESSTRHHRSSRMSLNNDPAYLPGTEASPNPKPTQHGGPTITTDALREVVLPRLERIKKSGAGFMAQCPSRIYARTKRISETSPPSKPITAGQAT